MSDVYEVQASDLIDDGVEFRVHLLVVDDAGPIYSGSLMLNGPNGVRRANQPKRLRAACDPNIQLSEYDRGTGETFAVKCKACAETQEYKERWKPKPKGLLRSGAKVSQAVDNRVNPKKKAGCGGCG